MHGHFVQQKVSAEVLFGHAHVKNLGKVEGATPTFLEHGKCLKKLNGTL